MIRQLEIVVVKNLNLFPNKEGNCLHYSPQMVLNKEAMDYKRYCELSLENM